MSDAILVINAGSSSLKFQVFVIVGGTGLERRVKGQIEGIGVRPRFRAADQQGQVLIDKAFEATEVGSIQAAIDRLVPFLRQHLGSLPAAVGHRVVHGGPDFSAPMIVTPGLIEQLERFTPLAPLHQPHNLLAVRTVLERQPQLPQVVCFDTGFHRGHPEVADRFAIPQRLYAEGVRRYGFHGLSYEYIASRLAEVAPELARGRVVVAHLGSGASMCAISNGKSVESTMGFTALDGLPMGTRCGQLDPGVVLYLMTTKGMTSKEIERLLYNECGLKGLSGISNDVRELIASSDPRASLALDCFAYRIALFAGMLAAAMGGIDTFVFTAGIGENAPSIRKAVAERLGWLGLDFDHGANAAAEQVISSERSRIACLVLPTDEELMIARHTLDLLRRQVVFGSKEKSA
jgi:acetate kinase